MQNLFILENFNFEKSLIKIEPVWFTDKRRRENRDSPKIIEVGRSKELWEFLGWEVEIVKKAKWKNVRWENISLDQNELISYASKYFIYFRTDYLSFSTFKLNSATVFKVHFQTDEVVFGYASSLQEHVNDYSFSFQIALRFPIILNFCFIIISSFRPSLSKYHCFVKR